MKALFNLLLSIPSALLGGFVFSHLWHWFIVRKFGLPELTFLEAVGVLIVISFPLLSIHMSNALSDPKHADVDSSTKGIITSLVTILVLYPIIFGAAYLWHLAIG